MKYNAFKLNENQWAVKTHVYKGQAKGKIFNNELDAKQWALHQSMIYYRDMMDKAWDELVEISETSRHQDKVYMAADDIWCDRGDLLA